MKTPVKPTKKRLEKFHKSRFYRIGYEKGIIYFLISFLIPAIIMFISLAKQKINPFGDRQMLIVDLWHQYFPFFRVLNEKLTSGGSFLYSWQNGLGTNFLSLISYYAASPLNWISVFFNEKYLREALTLILIIKVGLCGSFFSCFLRYTFKRKDFSICFFSTMFALCSYILGYRWNVMWFDTVALFPLVMLGIVAICREGKWKVFTVSLALSLISNYYVGYFTCIFSVFMFAAAGITLSKGIKDFFYKLWITARSAVIGIALGGFMLLPAYFGLQLTHSANNTFPKNIEWYESWTDIFANIISYDEPTMKEGLPNLACGMLAVTLLGVFLISAGIKIREKISAVLMLALVAVSCNMNILNYIWHGFHFTNMIPYRFSFIFSFVLIAAAYRAYDIILQRGIKIYQLPAMAVFPLIVYILNVKAAGEEEFKFTGPIKSSMILVGAFLLIFIAVKIFPFKDTVKRNAVLSICIGAAVISECYFTAIKGAETVGTSDYITYPARNDEIQPLLEETRQREGEGTFFRVEMARNYTLNDSALYGYYGISQFSSSANVSVTKFMKRIGLYGSEAGNRYYYRISTPVVNSMLGLKYVVAKTRAIKSEEEYLPLIRQEGYSWLYENNYPLSLGYMVNSDILNIEDESAQNPFLYQNDILKLTTGVWEDCYTAQPVALAEYDGLTVTKKGYGDYSFSKEDGAADPSVTYSYSGLDTGSIYCYVSKGGMEKANVKNVFAESGETLDVDSDIGVKDYSIVFPLGNVKAGDTAKVQLKPRAEQSTGSYKIMTYALNKETFEKQYEKLADEQLEITSFTDRKIEGKVNALSDGVLLLTMPYEKGWSVYVDGEKVKTMPVMGALMGAEVPQGSHEIVLKYVPEGFTAGVAATAAGTAVFGVLAYFDWKKNRKNTSVPESKEASGSSPEPETKTENKTEPEQTNKKRKGKNKKK